MRGFLLLIPALAIVFLFSNNAYAIQVDNANYLLPDSHDNPTIPYKLIDNATLVTVQTKGGTLAFNKTSCSAAFYNGTGYLVTSSDSYSVKAMQDGSGTWNPVSVVNNAACSTQVIENNGNISVIGKKDSFGNGVFSINYTKQVGQPFKITFSATNNNILWLNYHLGVTETLQVPQFVMLGNHTYDLSQYNGMTLNRAWLVSHNAQIIKILSHANYNMGIGWQYVNDIVIHWIGGKAYVDIDYTYNTPIISPLQTITVDPALDTSATCNTDAGTTCNITIGNNNSRLLIVELSSAGPAHYDATAVKIGSTSFTHLNKKRGGGSGTDTLTDIWYLTQNAGLGTGAQTVTITWTGTPQQSTIGLVSLYNVNPFTPIRNSTLTTAGGASVNPITLNITPTTTGSWIAAFATNQGEAMTSPNHTSLFSIASTPDNLYSVSQYYSSPTIGAANTLSWASTANSVWGYSMIDYEILNSNPPSVPTLTHANRLNSTAIQLDWPAVTNAAWYTVWRASPAGGSFSQIANTTSHTYTNISLTGGTQYQYKLEAGNATGISAFSNAKSNYTTNIAPTSLSASGITISYARLGWTNPSGNFTGFKIENATGSCLSFTTKTSNTGNSTNHYDMLGMAPGTNQCIRISTNYAFGTNASGTSSPSSLYNFTTLGTPTLANVTLSNNIIGDAIQLNVTTNLLHGSPPPTLKTLKLFINNTLSQTATINATLTTHYNYSAFWYQFPDGHNKQFIVESTISNDTGSDLSFNSSSLITHKSYTPTYFTATVSSLGQVNYTITRPTQTTLVLNANRDLGGATFPMECLYQTASQAMIGDNAGTWINKTDIGFWTQTQTILPQVYYITCYDPNEELFSTSSLVNGSSILFGIAGLDNTFGAFLGLPVGVFFVVMAASLGNRRTAPMWVVLVLAIAGMMATIGFFTLDQNVWYLAIIAGLLGLFVGRKLF